MVDNRSLDIQPVTLLISYKAADLTEGVCSYQRTTSMHTINRLVSIVGLLVAVWGIALLALDAFVLPDLFGGEFRLGLLDVDRRFLRYILLALIPLSALLWMRPFRPLAVWLDFHRNRAEYQKPREVRIDSRGILVKTSTSEGHYKWSAFSKVIESPTSFVLVYGPWQYAVLPKREFTIPGDIERAREYFQRQIE